MLKFIDNFDLPWTIDFSVPMMKRVMRQDGINLWGESEIAAAFLEDLLADPQAIRDVLYSMVKPQAITRGIGVVEFDDRLRGVERDAFEIIRLAIKTEIRRRIRMIDALLREGLIQESEGAQ